MIPVPAGPYALYVEDDFDDVELLTSVLELIGFCIPVIHLRDGTEALDFLEEAGRQSHLPRLIFMDINMPKLTGKETFACMQIDKTLSEIPVIILSTSQLQADIEYFRRHNVPYIVKPYDTVRFRQDLEHTLTSIFK